MGCYLKKIFTTNGFIIFSLSLTLAVTIVGCTSDKKSESGTAETPSEPPLDPPATNPSELTKYSVTYSSNNSTCGSVDVDTNSYSSGENFKTLINSNLTRVGYSFNGWNTQNDGGGSQFNPDQIYQMGASPLLLYANWSPIASPPSKVRIFIFAGQSNMDGTGAYFSGAPSHLQTISDVWFDYNLPATPTNATSWQTIGVASSKYGPEVSFADRIKKVFPNDQIAIIKVSQPSTGLSCWVTQGYVCHDFLFSRLQVIKSRLDDLVTNQSVNSYSFEGFFWMQGENEANSTVISESTNYGSTFSILVNELKTTLSSPNLPVVLGRVTTKIDPAVGGPVKQPQLSNVRSQQVLWANNTPKAAWVDTDDLFLIDSYHYGSDSQLVFGERMADAWIKITSTRPLPIITLAADQPEKSSSSFIDYVVTFNQSILELSASDISINTDTGADTVVVTELTPSNGTVFNVRVSGMEIPGTVEISIPDKAAHSCTEYSMPSSQKRTRVLWSPHASVSSLLAYFPFSSTTSQLHFFNSGIGFTNRGWLIQNNMTSGYVNAAASPLTYFNLLSTPGYASGGYNYNVGAVFLDLEKSFSAFKTSNGSATVDLVGSTIWLSYLIQPILATTQQIMALTRENAVETYTNHTVTVYQEGGVWKMNVLGAVQASTVPVTANQTYLMVLKLYIGGASSPSKAHLWINPDSSTLGGADLSEATANVAFSLTDSNFKFSAFHWYPGGSQLPGAAPNGRLDEIRLGTTYSAVTPTSPQ